MIIKTSKEGVTRMFDKRLSTDALVFEYGFAETNSKTGEAFLKAHPKDLAKATTKDVASAREARQKAAEEAEQAIIDAESEVEASS